MEISLSLNDICQLVVEKFAPGKAFHANLNVPAGMTDASIDVLVISIPPKNVPPVTPTTNSITVSPG